MKTKASGSNLIFLSGLPRSGSTLLNALLAQNPNFHTHGNSALCQLLWDMQVACDNAEQLKTSNQPKVKHRLCSAIPKIYYQDTGDKVIIDKCFTWTLPDNINLIENYITKDYKQIVLVRPVIEIVRSFVSIRKQNGWADPEAGLLDEGTEPIMRPLAGVLHAQMIDSGQFLFVYYSDLIEQTIETLDRIYDFIGLPRFKHQTDAIVNTNVENEQALGLTGLWEVRPTISRRQLDVELSPELEAKAKALID